MLWAYGETDTGDKDGERICLQQWWVGTRCSWGPAAHLFSCGYVLMLMCMSCWLKISFTEVKCVCAETLSFKYAIRRALTNTQRRLAGLVSWLLISGGKFKPHGRYRDCLKTKFKMKQNKTPQSPPWRYRTFPSTPNASPISRVPHDTPRFFFETQFSWGIFDT